MKKARRVTDRMPKADYFRMRLAQSSEVGLTDKVDYYTNRLAEMGEPIIIKKRGKVESYRFHMDECKRMGLEVLGPDVNESNYHFTVNSKGDFG